MGFVNGSISGERLVNFDLNVVAPNGATPSTYSRATNPCNCTCRLHPYTAVGAGPAVGSVRIPKRVARLYEQSLQLCIINELEKMSGRRTMAV